MMAAFSPLCPPPPLPIPPPPALRLVFDCVLAGLLTFLSTLLALALRRLIRRPAPASAAAFFHPYTSDGGGGERVLWCVVPAVQELCPGLPRAVFTGDADASPDVFAARAIAARRSAHIETNKSSLDLFGTNQTQQPSFMSDLNVQLPSAFGLLTYCMKHLYLVSGSLEA